MPENEQRFHDLCNALENEQVIPFIGSGMSVPSGLPSWPEFLRLLRCHSRMTEDDLETLLKDSFFEEAVEQIEQSMPARLFNERIEHDLQVDISKSINGAIRFLPELFDKLILTTNLDELLERLYLERNKCFQHVLAGDGIGDYRMLKATSRHVLLKLHGNSKKSEGRILSKAENDRAYLSRSVVRDELELIYKTNSLLCLGCSLGPDRIMSVLAEVAKIDKRMPRHYAFLHMPDDGSLLIREHFLAESGIFPIWYKGDHDECIQSLFVGMLQHLGKL